MSLGIWGGFRFRDNGFGASGFQGVGFFYTGVWARWGLALGGGASGFEFGVYGCRVTYLRVSGLAGLVRRLFLFGSGV